MSFYPFGLQLCDGTTDSNVQSHRYNGKELDTMHGLNTYDYGARQYNPVTARWDRIDPLAEKYYSISPYAYCAGNPVKYVDPDGRKIVLYSESDTQYRAAYEAARRSMKQCGTDNLLCKLDECEEMIILGPGANGNKYSSLILEPDGNGGWKRTIAWSPDAWLKNLESGVVLSPETTLVHEADHTWQSILDIDQFLIDIAEDPNNPYGSVEEERVITGSEQKVAEAHMDVKSGQVTRKNHNGVAVDCNGNPFPVLSKEIDEKKK